jgi:hypothetical protein
MELHNLLTKDQILTEFAKCLDDPTYPIINYLKTYDLTQEGFVPFKLFKKQHEIVLDYENYRFNLVTKPRQAGISTTTQAYLAVKAWLADKNKPETILVIANKLTLAKKFIKGIKDFVTQLPRWQWGSEYYGTPEKEKKSIWVKDSQIELELPNGSKIIAVATSTDALRGYTPTYLVFDEAAFIDDGAELYSAAITSLGTGGKAILISTPNGYDPLYYKTYEQSVKGENNYNVIEMRWYQDPRYNKDLRWIDKDNNQTKEVEFTFESFEKMVSEGYKPTSSWYENMCKELNNDKRKIAQELDVSFLGSGGNVIDDEYIVFQEKTNVKEPKYILGKEEEIWIWEEPIEGHEYILVADVSGGAGADYSVIQIIDFTTHEQVFEYRSKILADLLAEVVNEWGLKYNAYVIVDRVGVGQTTVLKLMEMKYPNLHWDNPEHKNLLDKRSIKAYSNDNRIAGFAVGNDRLNMVAHLEMMVRTNGIIIRSKRTTSEMRTFIYKNGKPDHMSGYNDDCLMSLAMGLWVLEHSFSKLKKANAQTKAMLDSWLAITPTTQESINNENKQTPNKKPNFHPSVSRNMQDPNGNYLWLFSKRK